MIHKRYVNEFEEPNIDIEFWCPETEEENEAFNRVVQKNRINELFFRELGG